MPFWLGQHWTPRDAAGQGRSLMRAEVLLDAKADSTYLHPLYLDIDGVPPGKVFHAFNATFLLAQCYDPFETDDDPETVAPLASQPLVEVCLRTPTYVLTAGGRDRAIARAAFSDDIPKEISQRQSKGGIEDNVKESIGRNMQMVREFLLDGVLMREGVLDRGRVESILSNKPTALSTVPSELYSYLSVEAWLRSWHDPQLEQTM